jgi:hypothetical protein
LSTGATSTRGLRNRPLGRLLLLAGILLAAFAVSRSCGSTDHEVSKDEAIAIAREAADIEPDRVQIRFVQRGIPPRQFWAVSLYTVDADDRPTQVKLLLVDARTGEIEDV